MRASELVEALQRAIEENGDLDVVNDVDQSPSLEVNYDSDEAVFVIV